MSEKQYPEQGKYLKRAYDYYKRHHPGYSYDKMVDQFFDNDDLRFSDKTDVSRYMTGENLLSEYGYRELASVWGLRLRYILGIDDFPTREDLMESEDDDFKNSFTVHLQYLEYLGYWIDEEDVCVNIRTYQYLKDHWSDIKPALTDEWLDRPVDLEPSPDLTNTRIHLRDWDGLHDLQEKRTDTPWDWYLPVRNNIVFHDLHNAELTNVNVVDDDNIRYTIFYRLEDEVGNFFHVDSGYLLKMFSDMDQHSKIALTARLERPDDGRYNVMFDSKNRIYMGSSNMWEKGEHWSNHEYNRPPMYGWDSDDDFYTEPLQIEYK